MLVDAVSSLSDEWLGSKHLYASLSWELYLGVHNWSEKKFEHLYTDEYNIWQVHSERVKSTELSMSLLH